MAQRVHVAIVLDRSGSMEDCRADAIGAVNSYLRQVRDDRAMDARITLITFDSESIDTIRDRVPGATCPELKPEEYQPRASTPLLDAVGHAAGLLDRLSTDGERRILAVMTDGLENASKEYTRERLKALLDRRQNEDGWLVLYLGAGHDSWAQARDIGVKAGNVADFAKANIAATSGVMKARMARYAAAPSPIAEVAQGGFTSAERDKLSGDHKPAA
jgi:Mg-chelatase subunit ChlD